MRKKPTLIVAGLTVAGAAGAFASTGSAIASAAAPSRAAASAPVDCAGIASSFGSQVPDSLTTFYDTVTASSSQIPKVDAPLTLFIPDNAAFDKIPANVLDSILADGDLLATILDYHLILGQALTADALAAAGSEPTAQGDALTFAMSGDTLTINGGEAAAVCPDIEAEGAVIHVIDGVLQPPSLAMSAGGCGPASSSPGSSTPVSSISSMATTGSSMPCASTPGSSTPGSSTP